MTKKENYFPNEMSKFVFYRTYSRWRYDLNRRESWDEAVDRLITFYKDVAGEKLPEEDFDLIKRYVLHMEVMPSMRLLWTAGDAAKKNNFATYNCLRRNTKFITSNGTKSFEDFNDGDETMVLTHNGNWKKAIIKSYGIQSLNKITIGRGRNRSTVYATKDHRWKLYDGADTTNLKVGDQLMGSPDIFSQFDYDNASPIERLYWCYGYVYGDGTKTKNKNGEYVYSLVRLCGEDARKFESRFLEMGFCSSSSASLKGDIIVYTGTYLKTAPDPRIDSPELIRAFVHGYLDADGAVNVSSSSYSVFSSIQSSEKDHQQFIENCFGIAGQYITKIDDHTGQVTNFGMRPETYRYSLTQRPNNSTNAIFTVKEIEETDIVESVWCLEVEDDHSFVLENGLVTGNCSFTVIDDISTFGEILYILMHGAGVGYSVERQYVDKLPTIKEKNGKTHNIVVEDSKEGWMLALNTLIEKMWGGFEVTWDVSNLRPQGAILKTFGGRSSGPDPLVDCFRFFQHMIEKHRGRKLSSLNVHDLCCKIAEVVVVGGVRRSSCISLSDLHDIGMRNSKQGQFWLTHPYRSMANNSAVFDHRPSSVEFMREWLSLAESGTGERGIFNRSNLKDMVPSRRNWEKIKGVNPCGEILLRSKSCCNLTEVVIRKEDTMDTLMEKVKVATIMGTIQSMLTNFGDLVSEQWKKNCEDERLLGVSLTGQLDNPDILTPENLQELRDYVVGVNLKWARKLGIKRSAACTTTKPSGTTSALVDSASGFHPRYAKYYIRRVRISGTDPLYKMMKDQGMRFVPEVGQTEKNATTWICEFPVKAPDNAVTRTDMTAIQQLEQWLKIKHNWAEHTVSATIYVNEDEWLEVGNWVYKHFDKISGLSFLPKDDHIYQLAPFEEITKDQYEKLAADMPSIDYTKLSKYEKEDYNSVAAKEFACSGGVCELR